MAMLLCTRGCGATRAHALPAGGVRRVVHFEDNLQARVQGRPLAAAPPKLMVVPNGQAPSVSKRHGVHRCGRWLWHAPVERVLVTAGHDG